MLSLLTLTNGYCLCYYWSIIKDFYTKKHKQFYLFIYKEKDLKDLHYCGRAKNFESIGDNYIVKTVWNENQSVDQATITVVSY